MVWVEHLRTNRNFAGLNDRFSMSLAGTYQIIEYTDIGSTRLDTTTKLPVTWCGLLKVNHLGVFVPQHTRLPTSVYLICDWSCRVIHPYTRSFSVLASTLIYGYNVG